jgi:hypothetical protein
VAMQEIQDGGRRHFELFRLLLFNQLLTDFNKILNLDAAHHAEKNY